MGHRGRMLEAHMPANSLIRAMMNDLARLAEVGAALLSAALAPCLIPALRTASIQPMVALKKQ